ncbi:MAG TPA: metalloregulator ArsR/SmtB family transcription factor [Thermoanaerobaculia bacterium]
MNDAKTVLPDACTDALTPFLRPELFRALGDPSRLALLARLAATPGAQSVTELSSCCGVHFSGVSRHLKILHDAGLIDVERQGREALYRLDCGALALALRGMADALEACQASCCGPRGAEGDCRRA